MCADEVNISKIADSLLSDIDISLQFILGEKNPGNNRDDIKINRNNSHSIFTKSIDQFQPCPQLMDTHLRSFINRITDSYIKNCLRSGQNSLLDEQISDSFYQFAKVRGSKTTSNFLNSDISLLPHVVKRVTLCSSWKSRYFLLLWLSVLILTPFPLSKIEDQLPDNVYIMSCTFLESSSGKETDAASVLMARFLSRVDTQSYLTRFITEHINSLKWKDTSVFTRIGILSTINFLLKISTLNHLSPYLNRISTLTFNELQDGSKLSSSVLKLLIKILGKISLYFLRMANFSRIEDAITIMLSYVSHQDTNIRCTVSKQISKICLHVDPQSRADIIRALINQLDISPVDGNVFQDTLLIDMESIDISLYHGTLMTFGQVCGMDSSSSCLYKIASIVHKTLFTEQHRLMHTVGSNVRDASCFTCWSLFRRHHDSEIPEEILLALFKDLILVCCFDGDLMIRRAASATMQELVGRHGDRLFDLLGIHGSDAATYKIKLIETLDYTVLGHTKKSYKIPLQLYTKLDGFLYTEFIDYLFKKGVTNYDPNLRKLSCYTLKALIRASGASDARINMSIGGLIKRYRDNEKPGLLYCIAELIELVKDTSLLETQNIRLAIQNSKFDFHHDNYSKGEEYLHLLGVMCGQIDFNLDDNTFDTVFNIIRIADKSEITSEFIFLSRNLTQVPTTYKNKWISYIRYGNIPSAKAIGYSFILKTEMNAIIIILLDTSKDAMLRSYLLDSISIYLSREKPAIDSKMKEILINQMDDYTVTNRGDVGNFVRLSAINLISENQTLFWNAEYPKMKKLIVMKLLRLTGEIMDNVKLRAFTLLRSLLGWRLDAHNLDQSTLLYHPRKYFSALLHLVSSDSNLFYDNDLMTEFWRGYCFSAGSPQAVSTVINSAIYSFLELWEQLYDNQKMLILNCISLLLKSQKVTKGNKSRFQKMQSSCLNFVCNILELNIGITNTDNLKVIFVRTYNLSLGTSNYHRMFTAIRIFTNLYIRDVLKYQGCRKRIVWIYRNHPSPKIRERAYEALQEIEFEMDSQK